MITKTLETTKRYYNKPAKVRFRPKEECMLLDTLDIQILRNTRNTIDPIDNHAIFRFVSSSGGKDKSEKPQLREPASPHKPARVATMRRPHVQMRSALRAVWFIVRSGEHLGTTKTGQT